MTFKTLQNHYNLERLFYKIYPAQAGYIVFNGYLPKNQAGILLLSFIILKREVSYNIGCFTVCHWLNFMVINPRDP